MKVVRLKHEDLRDWRENVSHLVDDAGRVVQKIDRPLEDALAMVIKKARSARKTLEQIIELDRGARRHTITVTMARAGQNQDDWTWESQIDGYRVFSGRDVFFAQMLAEHGECQLRMPNGVILKVLRDPRVNRPSYESSQRLAPRPEHCPCREWGHPHPGHHHITCQWNRLAPPDERAPSTFVPEEEIRLLPSEALPALARSPLAPAATVSTAPRRETLSTPERRPAPPPGTRPRAPLPPEPVPTPDEALAPAACRHRCYEWATKDGAPLPEGQHHPMCPDARAWAIRVDRSEPRWLVDLITGERVRRAELDEIGRSEVEMRRSGSPVIHIDDRPYAVVRQSALVEARAGVADAADLFDTIADATPADAAPADAAQ